MAKENFSTTGCSVAGTASLQQDSICYEDTTMLNLTGYVGTIQWQSYNGTNWINETGIGNNTASYSVAPGATKDYRAVVTNGVCVADTSNIITITVGTIPVPSGLGATRCGPGNVTVTGTGNGLLQWYNAPTGGAIIGTGSPFTTYVPGTTTLFLTDNSNGGGGGGGNNIASPILITELDFNDNASGGSGDDIEIQNVAPFPVDVTGWKIVAGDVPADINQYNSIINTLSGILQPGDIISFTDVTGPNYWGQNLFWNNGQNSWVMLLDSNYVIKDVVITDWDSVSITTMAPVINGFVATVGTHWTGAGVISTAATGQGVVRNGNIDSNSNIDFNTTTLTINTTNPTMTLPFLGLGCSSPRIPIPVTVTFADPVTTTALPPALCQGNSSLITATSNNANYNYTWSPATGLSTTTGASVTASPSVPTTYIVIGDDGTCANVDTVFMDVGPASNSGTATESVDTICSGNSAILNVAGTVGNIQWQGNTGAGWLNETGTGNTAATYIVSPTLNTLYRAVVTSGGCDPDTSVVLPVAVLNVASPTVNDTTICANSTVTLTATGAGAIAWYNSSLGGPIVSSGNTLTANVIGDTTFYAAEKGGSSLQVGPLNNSIGNSAQSANDGYGLGFNVTRLCVLEKVYVYPTQSGTLTVNLRNVQGGTILKTRTLAITASASKTPVALGWTLNPGTNFRLEIATGSVPLKYNYSGTISYPYTTSNGPLSITGFLNPFLSTTTQYFYFYDWDVFEGCYSSLVPLNVTTTPAQPVISQSGALLTSSASSGNQWYLNGSIITGATSQTYLTNQTGLYSVHVTIGSCTAIGSLNVTFIGIDELKGSGIAVYPNPVADLLTIDFDKSAKNNFDLRLINASGAVVFQENQINNVSHFTIDTKSFAAGLYLLELKNNDNIYRKTLVKN